MTELEQAIITASIRIVEAKDRACAEKDMDTRLMLNRQWDLESAEFTRLVREYMLDGV